MLHRNWSKVLLFYIRLSPQTAKLIQLPTFLAERINCIAKFDCKQMNYVFASRLSQSLQNTTTLVITAAQRSDHITPVLTLPLQQLIILKTGVLALKFIHCIFLSYTQTYQLPCKPAVWQSIKTSVLNLLNVGIENGIRFPRNCTAIHCRSSLSLDRGQGHMASAWSASL